jgi:16S rRNA G966 N2-methylase RsmD
MRDMFLFDQLTSVEASSSRVLAGDRPDSFSWDHLPELPDSSHEPRFVSILRHHGFSGLRMPVPLLSRYTKGRRWSSEELDRCYEAWRKGISLTLIAATLNRNPQDMIYKLLKRCRQEGTVFSERDRSEGSSNWNGPVMRCARELFEAGLPAWKIAVLFRVDFEFAEKALFLGRPDYGHRKKNPFSICTEHKQLVNEQILAMGTVSIRDALDLFAGEGRLTRVIGSLYPRASVVSVESDKRTFARAMQHVWTPQTTWINDDNMNVIGRLLSEGRRFDLIDLDPFVSCHIQLRRIWGLLRPTALVFITFGGEYRRSFIGSNRKAIAGRYGFSAPNLSNREYLETVPSCFLGWVAEQAAASAVTFEILRAVRYPNNCRFWLRSERVTAGSADAWLWKMTTKHEHGSGWRDLRMPRFREVRAEIAQARESQLPFPS